jgi:glycerol kinase
MGRYILALDQGTTSSRSILFDAAGKVIASVQTEFPQYYPRPGWVEQDAEEIWTSQLNTARQVIEKAGIKPTDIHCMGITNQRETVVLWDRETGQPVCNAVVWQCRRTADVCATLRDNGHARTFRSKTGLLLDPYFSGTKVSWLLKTQDGLQERARRGDLCFGTVDAWLMYRFTGRHVTDVTNASRTLLYNIYEQCWDDELLDILDIPRAVLPEVVPSSCKAGVVDRKWLDADVPVAGIAGDQHAALFGQACFEKGDAKNTYGTGCFLLVNTGVTPVQSENRLLTTMAWDLGNGPCYALEGSIFIAGAVVKWLRDEMGMISEAAESETLARSVEDNGGVVFVPAFVGLGAPYWAPSVRGSMLGLSRGSRPAHIVRAALESIACQSHDLYQAMKEDMGMPGTMLKVDGGASVNDFLMQFQADILGLTVVRSTIAETTALGAAYLAGLATGIWNGLDEIQAQWKEQDRFEPQMDVYAREEIIDRWHAAVNAAMQFTE